MPGSGCDFSHKRNRKERPHLYNYIMKVIYIALNPNSHKFKKKRAYFFVFHCFNFVYSIICFWMAWKVFVLVSHLLPCPPLFFHLSLLLFGLNFGISHRFWSVCGKPLSLPSPFLIFAIKNHPELIENDTKNK